MSDEKQAPKLIPIQPIDTAPPARLKPPVVRRRAKYMGEEQATERLNIRLAPSDLAALERLVEYLSAPERASTLSEAVRWAIQRVSVAVFGE